MPKKQLTIEEKMNNALVPEEEWPYKLPDNWCWVRLGAVNGYSSKSINPSNCIKEEFELYSVPSSVNNYPEILFGEEIGSNKQIVLKDDVLLCKINPRINRVWKVFQYTNKKLLASSEWIVVRSKQIVSEYMVYCFKSPYFRKYMLSNVSGVGGSLMRAQPKYVKGYPIPIPPILEQKRIVSRIESLFAKLDEAKEKIQNVLDGAESRKAAILHQAFTGKLTAKWRKENGVSDDSWEKKTLDSICVSIYDGDHMAPPKKESGIPFLVISNVNKGKLSFENTRFVSKEYYDSVSDTRKPQLGDVLYTIVGSYGIPVVVDNDRAFCFQRHMALLKPSKVDTYFLWYQLQTKEFYNKATEIATGTAQLTVPIKGLRKLKISLPVQVEQQEVVRRLDNLLNKEKSICESCEASLAAIEAMKKAILAKAFRGELGTNNPAEESSKELLREIISI